MSSLGNEPKSWFRTPLKWLWTFGRQLLTIGLFCVSLLSVETLVLAAERLGIGGLSLGNVVWPGLVSLAIFIVSTAALIPLVVQQLNSAIRQWQTDTGHQADRNAENARPG
jgi:hypothetical protein